MRTLAPAGGGTVRVMGRPALLVIDLDGTLLGVGGAVSKENRAALARARSEGLEVVIATGRALSECGAILSSIDYAGPLISAGGSLMVDAASGRTIDRCAMCPELVRAVVECIQTSGPTPLVLKDRHATGVDYLIVGDGPLHPVSTWWFDQNEAICRRVRSMELDVSPEHTVRVGAVGSPDEFDDLVRELESRFGDMLTIRHWPAVTSSAHAGEAIHLLEVFEPDADKWTMVQAHCDQSGVSPDHVCAIGDGLNDVRVIKECGLGVAMANAHAHVLEVADHVTGTHCTHGVARCVHDLLDGRLEMVMP